MMPNRRLYLLLGAITLLLSLVLPVPGFVIAQGGDAQADDIGIYGVAVYLSDTGDFLENNDGTYTLTMRGVSNAAPYWLAVPVFMPLPPEIIGATPASDHSAVGNMLVASTMTAWRTIDGLYAEAWLTTRDISTHILVYEPDFIPPTGELIFTVEILDVISIEEDPKGDLEPPTSFREGVLTITLDEELVLGLDVGFGYVIEGLRHTCEGSPRQQALCECKRQVDDDTDDIDARFDGYDTCNQMPPPQS